MEGLDWATPVSGRVRAARREHIGSTHASCARTYLVQPLVHRAAHELARSHRKKAEKQLERYRAQKHATHREKHTILPSPSWFTCARILAKCWSTTLSRFLRN